MATRVIKVRGGVRLEEHGCVLSEVLAKPGATHSIFDVLAAAVHAFSPGPRVAMLGFAGGGMMAPLRALGGDHAMQAVDLSAEGFRIYCDLAKEWGGELEFEQDDAVAWLGRQRGRFDAVVEDLSVPIDGDVVKPEVSWTDLPPLLERRVKAGGLVVTNLLPTPGMSWRELSACCRTGAGVSVEFADYHNRVLIQGRDVGTPRVVGAALRNGLRMMRSRMAEGVAVRALPW